MAEYVIDSSVAIKWFSAEDDSPLATRILDDFSSGSTLLLAPDLILAELSNVVWKKQRRGDLSLFEAETAVNEISQLTFPLMDARLLLADALALAVANDRTVYDMLYVALAVQWGCDFITADDRLVNAIGAKFPQIKRLADYP